MERRTARAGSRKKSLGKRATQVDKFAFGKPLLPHKTQKEIKEELKNNPPIPRGPKSNLKIHKTSENTGVFTNKPSDRLKK